MQNLKQEVTAFYDAFSQKLIGDYVIGNRRLWAAIEYAINFIPKDAKRILDIGCGIGWSTWEFKRHHPHASVLGIDISPRLIEIAQTLFEPETSDLSFGIQDLTEDGDIFKPEFDAIVMLDVYEHIPKEFREKLHKHLSAALKPEGFFIASCPSIFHQDFLREYQPEGLQPVDEDVTVEDLSKLAKDVKGHIIHYGHTSLGHTNDYIHVTIQRNPKYVLKTKQDEKKIIRLEPKYVRAGRVTSRLNVSLKPQTSTVSPQDKPVVCVVSPSQNAYSETFVRAHIERLPGIVKPLHGVWFPLSDDNKSAVGQFFWENDVEVVLAEFGPVGVALMEVCQEMGLPLIVHFHGADAYQQGILEQAGKHYPELFEKAAAIVAVSKDMERQLLHLGAPQEKIHYNPCGVDVSLFQESKPKESLPIFVATGRFVDKKAPHLTLLAFREVFKGCPQAKLMMMGDGPLWEACKQLANSLGIADGVDFMGVVSHSEVATTMGQARAFVQHSMRTSYGDSEGTPVAVLEAGASGIPVVATRHAGIKDVVVDGETGLLIDEGDVEGMAECMLRLAEDSALAANLGKAARERICAEFSMDRSISNLWHIVETTIDKKKASKLIDRLNLRKVNFIAFPDWSQAEELLLSQLAEMIKAVLSLPNAGEITLLLDTSNVSEENASLAISGVVMNLLMEEGLEVTEEPEVTLIGKLDESEWKMLLPQIKARIILESENQEAIAVTNTSIVSVKINDINDKIVKVQT